VILQDENGSDTIDAQNDAGDSALICAVRLNRPAIVEYLLERGADHKLVNKSGVSAIFLAADMKFPEVEALLVGAQGRVRKQRGRTESVAANSAKVEVVSADAAAVRPIDLSACTGRVARCLAHIANLRYLHAYSSFIALQRIRSSMEKTTRKNKSLCEDATPLHAKCEASGVHAGDGKYYRCQKTQPLCSGRAVSHGALALQ
jgi:hypothetical protein